MGKVMATIQFLSQGSSSFKDVNPEEKPHRKIGGCAEKILSSALMAYQEFNPMLRHQAAAAEEQAGLAPNKNGLSANFGKVDFTKIDPFRVLSTQELKANFKMLLLQYPAGQTLSLFQFLQMVILESWEAMEPQLSPNLKSMEEKFFENFRKFIMTNSAEFNLIRDSQDMRKIIETLKSSNQYVDHLSFFCFILSILVELNKLPESPEKKILMDRLTLLNQFIKSPDLVISPYLSCFHLDVFYDKGAKVVQLEDLLPSVRLACTTSKSLVDSNEISASCVKHFQKIYESFDQFYKLLENLKRQPENAESILSSIPAAFSILCCRGFGSLASVAQALNDLPPSPKNQKKRAQLIYDHTAIVFFLNVAFSIISTLELSQFNYPFSSLIEQLNTIMIVEEGTRAYIGKSPTQETADLIKIREDFKKLSVFSDKTLSKLSENLLKLIKIEGLYTNVPPKLFDFYKIIKISECFDRDGCIEHCKKIRRNLDALVSGTPPQYLIKNLEETLNRFMSNLPMPTYLNFCFVRDAHQLLTGENRAIIDFIPEEFFDILSVSFDDEKEPVQVQESISKEAVVQDQIASLVLKEELESVEPRAQAAAADENDLEPRHAAPLSKKELKKLPAAQRAASETLEDTALKDIKNAKKYRELEKILTSLKFVINRQAGSHVIFQSPTGGIVVVPRHDGGDLKPGTLSSIAKQAAEATFRESR
jgi:predicted RNA binding protein YcfA (HicA-like mRNA interferase family)